MFELKAGTQIYRVSFFHITDARESFRDAFQRYVEKDHHIIFPNAIVEAWLNRFPTKNQRGTWCVIQLCQDCTVSIIGTGASRVHPNDHFNKPTGRMKSLDRALKEAFPLNEHKEIRRQFWDAYFNTLSKSRLQSFRGLLGDVAVEVLQQERVHAH